MASSRLFTAARRAGGVIASGRHSAKRAALQEVALQDLLLEAEQLSAERGKARAGNLRHSFVARVGNNMQQFRDTFTPDRRDNSELGEVRSDRINHRGLLPDEQMACAVKHQAALLLRRLCWHEPHVGSGDRFANSLSVS